MIERGLLLASEAFAPATLGALAQEIETLGYDSLWLPDAFGREPVATAAHLLSQTRRLRLATGVANIYARDACTMAQVRRTLAEFSGGRFMLGLGVSNPQFNALRGHRWRAPYATLEAYLDAMADAPLPSPPPEALGPLYLAAHGPLLQRLARARADGIVTYLMPVEHARQSRVRLGEVPELNVVIPFLAETDPEQARFVIRRHLRHYVGLDYYQREWGKLGLADPDFQGGGSDRLVDAIAAWGDRAALEARVRACADAGATRVVIMPLDAQREGTLGPSTIGALAPARLK